MKPLLVQVREPEIGAKGFLIDSLGLFVLESGPGLLRGMACTHAGSGVLLAYDGLPNGTGFFENRNRSPMAAGTQPGDVWECAKCRGLRCPLCFGAGTITRASTNGSKSPIVREACPLVARKEHCPDCKGSGVDPDYWIRNGRLLKRLNQMGMWMLDAGFHHGLTIAVAGGVQSVHIVATVTWMAHGK
jgi:hypothetical protein